MRRPRRLALAGMLVAATSIAWLDPHQPVRDANKLYAEGKYEDAAAAYNAALVDRPDSAELHFNLGDATYKQGKYEEAVNAFQKVETAGDPKRESRVAYNVGNASFRKGQALEQTEPQKALGLYAEALASYRRALGLDPDDEEPKFNHEYVRKIIEDVKKRLEEQKKEQEQQQQEQPNPDEQNQDQQNKDEQQQDQQQQDDQQQAQDQQPPEEKQDEQNQQGQQDQEQQEQQDQKEQQQAGGEQQEEPPKQDEQQGQDGEQQNAEQQEGEQQDAAPQGDAVAGEEKEGELSKGEAAAILDSQRGEEVSPEDVIKKLQGARVAEPAQDW